MLMQISDIKKTFAGKAALCEVNMDIQSGQIIGLLGPNGSGKTTLLKLISGLIQADSGHIIYPNNAKRGVEAKKTISFLPDRSAFPSWMKVRDAFKYFEDTYPDYSKEKADEMIKLLELSEDSTIKKLSKGMQERVFLGLVFSRKTSLYLLDEPLGGIDPVGKSKVLESILSMQIKDASIIISTHLVKDVETIFDSVFFISKGKIIYNENCDKMREQSNKTVEQVYLEVFANA